MEINIVTNKKTRKENDEVLSQFEIVEADLAEDAVFTIPGVNSKPIDGQKVLVLRTEAGDFAVIGVPLNTDLEPGETEITGSDSSGNVKARLQLLKDKTAKIYNDKISITIDENGKIEIKNVSSDDLVALIHALAEKLQTTVTDLIAATVPTSLGPQVLSVAASWPGTLLPDIIEIVQKINSYKK